jgi:hypothetical protein
VVICPNCVSEQPEWADACIECGATLRFLREHPRRVGAAVWACMLMGLGLLLALFATVFDQLMRGTFPALGRVEVVELVGGVTLSLLGARAWVTLKDVAVHHLPLGCRR